MRGSNFCNMKKKSNKKFSKSMEIMKEAMMRMRMKKKTLEEG